MTGDDGIDEITCDGKLPSSIFNFETIFKLLGYYTYFKIYFLLILLPQVTHANVKKKHVYEIFWKSPKTSVPQKIIRKRHHWFERSLTALQCL